LSMCPLLTKCWSFFYHASHLRPLAALFLRQQGSSQQTYGHLPILLQWRFTACLNWPTVSPSSSPPSLLAAAVQPLRLLHSPCSLTPQLVLAEWFFAASFQAICISAAVLSGIYRQFFWCWTIAGHLWPLPGLQQSSPRVRFCPSPRLLQLGAFSPALMAVFATVPSLPCNWPSSTYRLSSHSLPTMCSWPSPGGQFSPDSSPLDRNWSLLAALHLAAVLFLVASPHIAASPVLAAFFSLPAVVASHFF